MEVVDKQELLNKSTIELKTLVSYKQFLRLIEEAKNYLEFMDRNLHPNDANMNETVSKIEKEFFDHINNQLEDIETQIKNYRPTWNSRTSIRKFLNHFNNYIKEETHNCPYCENNICLCKI